MIAEADTDTPSADGSTSKATTTDPAAMLMILTRSEDTGGLIAAATSALKLASNVVRSVEPAVPATVSKSPLSVRVAVTDPGVGGGGGVESEAGGEGVGVLSSAGGEGVGVLSSAGGDGATGNVQEPSSRVASGL